MTVYIDVLILLNLIIDFFIIQITSRITSSYIKLLRLIIASFIASLFSLLIFLPDLNYLFDFIIIISSGIFITLIAFGRKKFLKNFIAYLSVNIIYNGLMNFVFRIIKPKGMIFSNSFLYLNVSPLIFIFLTVVFYFVISFAEIILRKRAAYGKRCIIKLNNNNKSIEIKALIDTGNSICDPYLNRQVIITDIDTAKMIFENIDDMPKILLPVASVNGEGLIPAYVCKSAQINNSKKIQVLVAVTKHIFTDDYKAIVGPQILEEV